VSTDTATWHPVCPVDDLLPERGVAALINGHQIALFRLRDDRIFALGNKDPFSGANVMSRGIVGDRAGVPKVASPIYKQNFALEDGRCLDDDSVSLPVYPVNVENGSICIQL
jgi:nitrite reductase (NADH) small subunit